MATIMYAFAAFDWSFYGVTLYWSFINFVAMDAVMSKNVEQANSILMPFQMLICLFNGLTLTKASAPTFLRPFLYVSPLSLAMEGIAYDMFGPEDSPIWAQLIELYQYDTANIPFGTAICLGLTLLGRMGQVLALKKMHNISK